jgi:hypothetical protein
MTSLLSLSPIIDTDVSIYKKLGAGIIEFTHCLYVSFFVLGLGWLLVKSLIQKVFNYKLLLLLNVMYLIIVLNFYIYKLCLANVFYNRLLNIHDCTEYYSFTDVVFGRYVPALANRKNDCNIQREKWFVGNQMLIFLLIIVNIVYIIYMKND